jgi:hypothetical protein
METVDGTLLRMKGYPVHLGHTLEPERPGVKHPCTSGQDQQLHKDDHLSDTFSMPHLVGDTKKRRSCGMAQHGARMVNCSSDRAASRARERMPAFECRNPMWHFDVVGERTCPWYRTVLDFRYSVPFNAESEFFMVGA